MPKITEFVWISYTIAFRPGMTFNCTLKRAPGDYLPVVRETYENENPGCALPTDGAEIISIVDGYR